MINLYTYAGVFSKSFNILAIHLVKVVNSNERKKQGG